MNLKVFIQHGNLRRILQSGDMLCESYNRLFNKEALVETMHAGVECGIMAAKIDDLDCVSFGY